MFLKKKKKRFFYLPKIIPWFLVFPSPYLPTQFSNCIKNMYLSKTNKQLTHQSPYFLFFTMHFLIEHS